MNINVSAVKAVYDAFDLGDPRVGVPLDPIPVFMTMRLDKALLRPVEAMLGGKGAVQYRRALGPSVFLGPWAYVDHVVLPPGATVGPNTDADFGAFGGCHVADVVNPGEFDQRTAEVRVLSEYRREAPH